MSGKQQAKASTMPKGTRSAGRAAEFDKEFVADSFRAPTPRERVQWRRAKGKRGRPRQGRGVKVISVSVERGLLRQCDSLAKRLNISRASLISRGLKRMLSAGFPG